MSESEEFLKLREISDGIELLMESNRSGAVSHIDVQHVERLLNDAVPLLELLGLDSSAADIREALRKKGKGIPYSPSQWIMAQSLELTSACDLYCWRRTREDKLGTQPEKSSTTLLEHQFISRTRIADIARLPTDHYDFTKLIRLCEEVNIAHKHGCHLTVAFLVRTIGNHVPPIFGAASLTDVAAQSSKSVKHSLTGLAESMKNIADHHLHEQIKKKVSLPTEVQVNCYRELDVLLSEVVRKMSSQ